MTGHANVNSLTCNYAIHLYLQRCYPQIVYTKDMGQDSVVSAAGLSEAIARLDRDIAEAEQRARDAEQRVVELHAMRASIQPFIERYVAAAQVTAEPSVSRPASLTDEVIKVFENHPGEVLDVDEALAHVLENGVETTRVPVRNAINYAVRLGKVVRAEHRRGRYILKDTSTPAGTGVEVNGELNGSSPRERGDGRDEASAPPRDQAGSTHRVPNPFDRVGDRAPIGGG